MGKVVVHNKLVRDNMPEIILTRGATSVTRQLSDVEYSKELLKKLIEEAKELFETRGSLKERVDVAEVLLAIDEFFGYSAGDIEQLRQTVAAKSGAFKKRIYLESTEEMN